jgi:acetyl-CoA acyltransferase
MCIGIGMGGAVVWENPHWSGDEGARNERTRSATETASEGNDAK